MDLLSASLTQLNQEKTQLLANIDYLKVTKQRLLDDNNLQDEKI